MNTLTQLKQFYELLSHLGDPQLFSTLETKRLPKRGVYFFFEEGEQRTDSGNGLRVVRVGTHALRAGSKSTLAGRLRQHRGSPNGGNHRGSIFRLLVGQALIARNESLECPSWGVKGQLKQAAQELGMERETIRSSEKPIEQLVSEIIGRMRVVYIAVEDEPGPNSLRGFIERNTIALLGSATRGGIDTPSSNWLGNHSDRPGVLGSGLWNQQYTDGVSNTNFLADLAKSVGQLDTKT